MRLAFLTSFVIVILSGCASIPQGVSIDYDPEARFEQYKTFYWSDEILQNEMDQPLFYNSLVKKRIKNAVEKEMTGRGYELMPFNPDLYINAHMIVEQNTEVQSNPGVYRYYWQDNIRTINTKEGTLVIDVIDRDKQQLVWQGAYKGSILDAKKPEDKQRVVRDAVSVIFREYDYRASDE